VLASALLTVDPTEAGQLARGALARAAAAGDDGLASAIAGDLMNLLLDAGRLAEALELAGQKAGYTRRAGLGPWTQLSDQARRLQILALMGEHEQVLAETETLRGQMSQLPDRPGDTDPVPPWNVREGILNTGYSSALALRWWPLCLELNAEIVASTRQRGAGEYELARTRFSDAAPLINMGRVEDAGRLLRWCQQVFEDHRDTAGLATVLSVRAGLEDELGHRQAAGDFARAALRLGYARPVPHSLAINHNNLAIYLGAAVEDRTEQRAHWLLAGELREDAAAEGPPVTVAEVVTVAERTEGVRLGELLAALEPDPQAVEAALAEILRAAADLPPDDEPDGADIAGHLEQWEPVIAVIVAACQGDQAAVAELRPFLDKTAQDPDWATLAAVLLRILAGERGDGLLDGLDPVDTAIATETLRRFTPGDQDPEARRQPGTTLS